MVSLVLLAVGTVVPCGMQPEPVRVRVGLYADFQQEFSPAIRELLKEELAALLIPIGVLVDWRSPASPEREQWRTAVASVTFRGRCEASDLWPRPAHPWVFGQTHVIDGQVIPYAEIDCHAIRAYLAPTLASVPPNRRTLIFGRAVSRVVAHELYHMLAKTPRHGSGGMGKRFYTARELSADGFGFQEREIQALRLAVFPQSAPAGGQAGKGACRGE